MAARTGVQGVDQLVYSLAAAARDLADLTDSEAGQVLLTRGQQTSPYWTGVLAQSHSLVVDVNHMYVVAAAPYAAIVHARDPWLTADLVDNTARVVDLYAADVAEIVSHIKGA